MDEVKLKRNLRGQQGLQEEILKEMAEALGNSGERLERSLERLTRCEATLQRLLKKMGEEEDPAQRSAIRQEVMKEAQRYNTLRKAAVEALRYLIIHREAVGFRNHRLVHEKFRIPPPVRLPWSEWQSER
jgi:hypothetical protein